VDFEVKKRVYGVKHPWEIVEPYGSISATIKGRDATKDRDASLGTISGDELDKLALKGSACLQDRFDKESWIKRTDHASGTCILSKNKSITEIAVEEENDKGTLSKFGMEVSEGLKSMKPSYFNELSRTPVKVGWSVNNNDGRWYLEFHNLSSITKAPPKEVGKYDDRLRGLLERIREKKTKPIFDKL
jgi:hypothetical protein